MFGEFCKGRLMFIPYMLAIRVGIVKKIVKMVRIVTVLFRSVEIFVE